MDENKTTSIYAALAKAQAEFLPVKKGIQGAFGKYADLAAIFDAVRPALNKYGLYVFQKVTTGDGFVTAETFIAYETGEVISSGPLSVPYANNNRMTLAQVIGSARTYACRYSLSTFLGIAADDDDDGSGTGKGKLKQPEQKPLLYPSQDLLNRAQDAAEKGTAAYQEFFYALDSKQRKALIDGGYHGEFKQIASEADNG